MHTLTQNVISIFGENGGKLWLANLPNTITILTNHWKLSNITPVVNMTSNCVAKATRSANQSVFSILLKNDSY